MTEQSPTYAGQPRQTDHDRLLIATARIPYQEPIGIQAGAILNRVAVHPTVNWYNQRHPGGEWTITHLKSGRAIVRHLPTAALAVEYAYRFDALPELDYHRNVAKRSPRVRAIYEELGTE